MCPGLLPINQRDPDWLLEVSEFQKTKAYLLTSLKYKYKYIFLYVFRSRYIKRLVLFVLVLNDISALF